MVAKIDAFAEYRLPSLGLQLETFHADGFDNVYKNFYKKTRVENVVPSKCPYCGLLFLTQEFSKKDKRQHFCCVSHARKYFAKIQSENAMKIAVKLVSNAELKEFHRKYNNFVYSEIYQYSEFQDDLMDWWNFNSIKILANMKRNGNEGICFNYLKISIKNAFLIIKKQRSKEVFYSELSIKKQIQLFGEPIEERI